MEGRYGPLSDGYHREETLEIEDLAGRWPILLNAAQVLQRLGKGAFSSAFIFKSYLDMRAFPGLFWHSDETEDTDANPTRQFPRLRGKIRWRPWMESMRSQWRVRGELRSCQTWHSSY